MSNLNIGELTGSVSLDASGVARGAAQGEAAAARMAAAVLADLRRVENEKAVAKLDADASSVEHKISAARADVARLDGARGTAKGDADVAAAESKLRGLESQLAGINSKRAQLKVDADTAPAEQKVASFGERVSGGAKAGALAAGAAAGAGFASGVGTAMDIEAANAKFRVQVGGNAQVAANLGAVTGNLFARGYADNMGAINDATAAVVQSGAVMEGASNAQIESITAKAMDLGRAFDQDVGQVAIAAGQAVRNGLGSSDEVMDAMTAGLSKAGAAGDDLLESFQEYSPHFAALGLNASEAMGLMNQGLQGGARNLDQVADGIKEFSIRAIDGSKTTGDAFSALGLNAGDMAQKIAAGGPSAKEAFGQVLTAVQGVEDPVKRDAIAVALFGTKAEDMKKSLGTMNVSTAVSSLGQVSGSAEEAGRVMEDTAQRKVQALRNGFDQLLASAVTLPGPIGDTVGALAAFGGGALDSAGSLAMIAMAMGPLAPKMAGLASTAATTAAAWISNLARMIAAGAVWVAQTIAQFVVWAAGVVAQGAVATASFAATAARYVAAWVMMAARGAASVALLIAQMAMWAGGIVVQGAIALASLAVTAAGYLAQWIAMAAGAMARAVIMAAAWLVAMGPIGWIIAALIALVALVIANWDTVKAWTVAAWSAIVAAVVAAWEWIKNAVVSAAQAVWSFLVSWGPTILAVVAGPIGWLVGLVITYWDQIVGAISAAGSFIINFLSTCWSIVTGAARAGWAMLVGAVSAGISAVMGFVSSLPGRILGALSGLGSLLLGSGRALVDGFLSGIKNAWNSVVSWVKDGIAAVRALFPFSPAKDGPFSGQGYVTHSGRALTSDFASALRGGMPGVIASARDIMDNARGVLGGELGVDLAAGRSGSVASSLTTGRDRDEIDPAVIADAVRAGVHHALNGAEMRVSGRGVATLVNRQNATDRRLGAAKVPVMAGRR